MKASSGFRPGPIPGLTPVLKKWIYVNNEYTKRCNGNDAPWWNNERSCMSLVAVAAWLAKGIAIEEYATTKTDGPGEAKNDRCRADLFISLPNGSARDIDLIIEAKICWPTLAGQATRQAIADKVEEARKDARRTLRGDGEHRAGAVFVTPRLIASRKQELPLLTKQFVEVLYTFTDCAVAWTFPAEASGLYAKKYDSYYPGSALLLKPLRRMD